MPFPSDVVHFQQQGAECATCCLLFKFCMASPGLPCPRPCPVRLLLARGSFRPGEGRNGDGEASSDRTPSWTETTKTKPELVTTYHMRYWEGHNDDPPFSYLVEKRRAVRGVFGERRRPAHHGFVHAVAVIGHAHAPLVQIRLLLQEGAWRQQVEDNNPQVFNGIGRL